EPRFASGKCLQRPLNVALLRFAGFQSGKVTENFFLPARRQSIPSFPGGGVPSQLAAEPARHRISRAASIVLVELDCDAHDVTDARTGRFANAPMQVEKEAAIADGHHVYAPGLIRVAVDSNAHRHRLAPTALQAGGLLRAHEHVRIDPVDLDACA